MTPNLSDIKSLPLSKSSVEHPLMLAASEKIMEAIMSPDTRQVTLVIGPTGVGKSHLKMRVARQVIARYADEMRSDPQFNPVADLTLRLDSQTFSWKSFCAAYLRSLGVPFPSFRTIGEARDKIVQAVQARRVKVTLIDEAHHMLYVGSNEAVVRQAEILKNLAEETGVKHACFGTYALTRLVRENGQLSRRNEIVHFPRYDHIPADMADFHKVLRLVEKGLAGHAALSLSDETDYLYEGCVGLVGVLCDWLAKAYTNAQLAGEGRITEASLGDTILSVLDRKKILDEALDGESELTATEADEQEYRKMLSPGWVAKSVRQPPLVDTNTMLPANRRRPGQRIPRRDTLHV